MKTYIIGHQNPDVDSIISPIVYADLLKSGQNKGEFIPARCGKLNKETELVLDKFKTKPPVLLTAQDVGPDDKIILVDHNEKAQRMEELDSDKIIGILDHHKLNLSLNRPIRVITEPWGASATLIYQLMTAKKLRPSQTQACLLLAAVLSDTLGLTSPTTTEYDRTAVEELKKIAGIDWQKLLFELYQAKSDLSGMDPEDIVKKDHKVFKFGQNVFINQLETTDPSQALKLKSQLIVALQKIKTEMNVSYAFMMITDLLKKKSLLLCADENDQRLAQKAFGSTGRAEVLDIGPRVSRKKEVAPSIEKALT